MPAKTQYLDIIPTTQLSWENNFGTEVGIAAKILG